MTPKLIDGKYVLLTVAALGLAGAGGGWWYHQSLQRRPLELWGHEAAGMILRAGDVDLCRLEPATEGASPSNAIEVNGETYEPMDCKKAAAVPGFLHLRHSLLNDYSFEWSDPATGKHDWRYSVRFREGPQTFTLLISNDCSYIMLVETGAKASIKPIAGGIKHVFGETWPGRRSKQYN